MKEKGIKERGERCPVMESLEISHLDADIMRRHAMWDVYGCGVGPKVDPVGLETLCGS